MVRTPVSPGGGAPEMSVSAPSELIVVPLSDALDDTSLVNDRHLQQTAAALLTNEGTRASLDGSAALAAPEMRGATVVVPITGRAAG